MNIEFIAHATCLISLNDGRRIVIDPYESMIFNGRFNYPPFEQDCEVVVISHEHRDHNYIGDLRGDFVVVRDAYEASGLRIYSQEVWHDQFEGSKFGGAVRMFFIEAEGFRLCHMSDCGEILSDAQIAAMGDLDLLFIPVGGFYTLDAVNAAALTQRIKAKTTVPIHYKTPYITLPIEGVEAYLNAFPDHHSSDNPNIDSHLLPLGVLHLPSRYH